LYVWLLAGPRFSPLSPHISPAFVCLVNEYHGPWIVQVALPRVELHQRRVPAVGMVARHLVRITHLPPNPCHCAAASPLMSARPKPDLYFIPVCGRILLEDFLDATNSLLRQFEPVAPPTWLAAIPASVSVPDNPLANAFLCDFEAFGYNGLVDTGMVLAHGNLALIL
jgi:hypothetical protein